MKVPSGEKELPETKVLSPAKLRQCRLDAKFKKLATAARAAHINRKTLIRLETEGEDGIKDPSHRVLESLSRTYGCEISDFYDVVKADQAAGHD